MRPPRVPVDWQMWYWVTMQGQNLQVLLHQSVILRRKWGNECLESNDNTDLSIWGTLCNFVGDAGANFQGMTEWDA